jgi:protein TonB
MFFLVAGLLSIVGFASDNGFIGEDGTEIVVTRVSNPAPLYPRRAIRMGLEGSVKVEFDVDTDGSVLDPYVLESTPASTFDRAAIKAVRKILYRPPTFNGTSVKVNNVQSVIIFNLADSLTTFTYPQVTNAYKTPVTPIWSSWQCSYCSYFCILF